MKNEVIINGIKIDVRSNKSAYITINDMIFYLEHSDVAPKYVDIFPNTIEDIEDQISIYDERIEELQELKLSKENK